MKRLVAWSCVCFAVLLIGTAAAAEEAELDATEYTFSDENVLGDLPGMESVSITVRTTGKDRSLIRLRNNFVYEMLKTVETM